jgi:hypothetical protein
VFVGILSGSDTLHRPNPCQGLDPMRGCLTKAGDRPAGIGSRSGAVTGAYRSGYPTGVVAGESPGRGIEAREAGDLQKSGDDTNAGAVPLKPRGKADSQTSELPTLDRSEPGVSGHRMLPSTDRRHILHGREEIT